MMIQWGYIIPQPNDFVHLSVWYSIDGGKPQHAVTYHAFYDAFLGTEEIDLLEVIFPGETIEFKRLPTPKHYKEALLPYFMEAHKKRERGSEEAG